MAAKLKVDQLETVDGTGIITANNQLTVNNQLTATSFAGDGSNLTALNATNLGSGTVPTARLGTGTADSSVHLRGDGTWAEVSSVTQQDPTVIGYKDLDSIGHHNVGTFTIDSRGRYRIGWDFRMGWNSQSGFCRTYLGTSSAGGQIGNSRMIMENMTTNAGQNANLNIHFQQVMDFGTSLSYPYTVYVNVYTSSAGSGWLCNVSDSNGYPVVSCLRVADIATATGMVAFGS